MAFTVGATVTKLRLYSRNIHDYRHNTGNNNYDDHAIDNIGNYNNNSTNNNITHHTITIIISMIPVLPPSPPLLLQLRKW